MALDLESIRLRLLLTKLGFCMLNDAGGGAEMMRVMSDDVESLCLVKECRGAGGRLWNFLTQKYVKILQ